MDRMKSWKKKFLCSALSGILVVSTCFLPASAYKAEAASLASQGISYEGEQNVLDRAEYSSLGMELNSPAEFDKNDTSHPLEDYEPVQISELYMGEMNRTSHYKGSFRVMNETAEVSSNAFNVENMKKNLVGNEVSFHDFYEADNDPIEVQTNNTCAIDYNGDGTDEILNMTLYVDRDQDKCSFMDLRAFDLESGKWAAGAKKTYRLSKNGNDEKDFVWEITADTSKSYTSMTAGDFDDDGKEEAAVYVASKEEGDAYVAILEINENKAISQKDTIKVSALNDGNNKFNMKYNDWYLPVVSLSTTKISGRDDLVINVSNPRNGDSDDIGHTAAMGIYHCNSSGKMTACYTDKKMVYGGNRIRFAAAVDGDINGNGVEELLLGGNINNDWEDNSDKGSISSSKNYLQVLTWNEEKQIYEKVWDAPKTVEGHGDLKVSEAMNEPVAIASAKIRPTSNSDYVFLEGVLFGFSGGDQEGTSEKALLEDGSFYKELKMGLGGDNSAFISTAQSGVFSSANGVAEQLVVLAGDHRSANNDNMYYDIAWIWESNGSVTSQITNNDYFDLRNEDDDGTFLSICAMDVDKDAVYVEYVGKEYGWTAPELFTVLQSTPYWKELDYDGQPGATTFAVSYGKGDGTEADWSIQLGISFNATLLAGVGLGQNQLNNGLAIGLTALGGYMGNRSSMITKTDTWQHTVPSGEDYAILFAIPVVDYKYKMWVPETEVTEEYIAQYEEMYGEDCPYKEGEIIGGEMQDCSISAELDATFSAVPLETYNAFIKAHPETGLRAVTAEDLEDKTIGDPTTYPQTKEELLSQVDEVEDSFHKGKYSANISQGSGSTDLAYAIESSKSKAHGFHFDLDFHIGWAGEIEAGFLFSAQSAWTLEGVLSGGGGKAWVDSTAKGIEFTTTYTDLPPGTDASYNYNVNLGLYQLQIPSGIDGVDNYDHPYVVSYLVNNTDENTAPPKIAENITVFDTTSNAALLIWEGAAYRPAAAYKVYVQDNLGKAQCLGTTEKHYYWANGLDADTEYKFAVQSVTDQRESVLSRWISGRTEPEDPASQKMPYFVKEPQSVIYSISEAAADKEGALLTAEAKSSVTGAKISYQWQKLVTDDATDSGIWQDISGATESSYRISPLPTQLGRTYYRVIATQQKDSNYKSIISKAAFVMIAEHHVDVKQVETEAELSLQAMKSAGGRLTASSVYYQDIYYLTSKGEQLTLVVNVKQKETIAPMPVSGTVRLYYVTDEGEEITIGVETCDEGKAVFAIDDYELLPGKYTVYAAYMGNVVPVEDDNGNVVLYAFLPSNTEKEEVQVPEQMQLPKPDDLHLGISEPSPEGQPDTETDLMAGTEEKEKTETPETGDEQNLAGWMLLAVCSIVLLYMGGLLASRSRRL